FIVQRFYNVKYEFRRIATMTVFTVLIFVVHSTFDFSRFHFSMLLVKILFLLAFPILLLLSKFFDTRELASLKRLLRLA
ncbi:MAG: hypothetical protein AABZ61_10880, partial [Bacteroidota bacterium]